MYLCERCNNNTGSWYGNELVIAARSAARSLPGLPLDELDGRLELTRCEVKFMKSDERPDPHPLRFIKQVVTMMLAIGTIEFTAAHPNWGTSFSTVAAQGLTTAISFT